MGWKGKGGGLREGCVKIWLLAHYIHYAMKEKCNVLHSAIGCPAGCVGFSGPPGNNAAGREQMQPAGGCVSTVSGAVCVGGGGREG